MGGKTGSGGKEVPLNFVLRTGRGEENRRGSHGKPRKGKKKDASDLITSPKLPAG